MPAYRGWSNCHRVYYPPEWWEWGPNRAFWLYPAVTGICAYTHSVHTPYNHLYTCRQAHILPMGSAHESCRCMGPQGKPPWLMRTLYTHYSGHAFGAPTLHNYRQSEDYRHPLACILYTHPQAPFGAPTLHTNRHAHYTPQYGRTGRCPHGTLYIWGLWLTLRTYPHTRSGTIPGR